MTYYWNNLHQVRSRSKDWKSTEKIKKSLRGKEIQTVQTWYEKRGFTWNSTQDMSYRVLCNVTKTHDEKSKDFR